MTAKTEDGKTDSRRIRRPAGETSAGKTSGLGAKLLGRNVKEMKRPDTVGRIGHRLNLTGVNYFFCTNERA